MISVPQHFGPSAGTASAAILCLHSLGLDGASFAGMADALGAEYGVVAFDQRGHGTAKHHPPPDFSALVADAAEALAGIDAETVHLVGHSMGGAVAAVLASQSPRVASLTILASPAKGLPVFADRAIAGQAGLNVVIAETLQRWFGTMPIDQRAHACLSAMTAEGFDASWQALSQFQGYALIAAALPPTLCLSFEQDQSTPPTVLDQITRTINSQGGTARHVILPKAGHMGLLTHPDDVATELRGFLTTLTPNKNEALAHG